MDLPIFVVDAFTETPFSGNPAGVCLLLEDRSESWMQKVAAEMRHAETAFLRGGRGGVELRWFTPTIEVDLCGHATLASAHILYEQGIIPEGQPIKFLTRSGELTAERVGDKIQLDFPSEPACQEPRVTVEEIKAALLIGVEPVEILMNRMDVLVVLEDADIVEVIEPDMVALGEVPARGVIVTARSKNPEYDFVSRFFGPAAGVPEDPVTGSAHCFLAPYWGEKLGKTELRGYQASRRGGVVGTVWSGDRVTLIGQAVTLLEGNLKC